MLGVLVDACAGAVRTLQIASASSVVERLEGEVAALQSKVADMRTKYQAARKELDAQRAAVAACDEELKELMQAKAKASKAAGAAELKARKVELKIGRWRKDSGAAESTVDHMLQKHPWIETERQCVGQGCLGLGGWRLSAVEARFRVLCLTHEAYSAAVFRFFGQPHTDYDFEARDSEQALSRMNKLDAKLTKLSKRLNKKVVGMIETAEKEYQELMKKKRIIENDKAKIEVRRDTPLHPRCPSLPLACAHLFLDHGSSTAARDQRAG